MQQITLLLSRPESIEFSVSGDEQNIIRQKTVTSEIYLKRVTNLDKCYCRFHIQGDSVHSVHSILYVLLEGGSGQLLHQTRKQYYSLQVDLHWY